MNSDVVEINCHCIPLSFGFHSLRGVIFDLLHRHLSNFNEYKCTRHDDDLIMEFKIGGENIRIKLTYDLKENIDVYVIGWPMDRSNNCSDYCCGPARVVREHYSSAPIIIVCFCAEQKYLPGEIKKAELNGDKMSNKKIGDKLARELGAVKYIECSNETGRGAKILIDEIAFAGIRKIKDNEKRRNKRKCNII